MQKELFTSTHVVVRVFGVSQSVVEGRWRVLDEMCAMKQSPTCLLPAMREPRQQEPVDTNRP